MGLIAIGDIHGCATTLNDLLEALDFAADDHLVFVGDYIDRGPDSKAVIDTLLELDRSHTCTFLRGNHEALMLAYLDQGEFELWRINGGTSTLSSYLGADRQVDIPDDHVRFVRGTELYLDTDDFFFVHAGIPANMSVQEAIRRGDADTFLWERGHLGVAHPSWEKVVVCGHTPQAEPMDRDKLINIDTGCVYYDRPGMGRLTAVRLPERQYTFADYSG